MFFSDGNTNIFYYLNISASINDSDLYISVILISVFMAIVKMEMYSKA